MAEPSSSDDDALHAAYQLLQARGLYATAKQLLEESSRADKFLGGDSGSTRAQKRKAAPGNASPQRKRPVVAPEETSPSSWLPPATEANDDPLELHSRFAALPDSFTFEYAGLEAFFAGLEGLIGSPSPDVLAAQTREHSSDAKFSSHNVRSTSPRCEWAYVLHGRAGDADGRERDSCGRDGWRLSNFVAHPNSRRAGLLLEEVAGLRAYTGPLYIHYNARTLRRRVRGAFVTTLHAINSGILKLSRHTKAATVYRGVAGGVLPEAFWRVNAHGVRGGVERGFMSCTTDRAVALEVPSRPHATRRRQPVPLCSPCRADPPRARFAVHARAGGGRCGRRRRAAAARQDALRDTNGHDRPRRRHLVPQPIPGRVRVPLRPSHRARGGGRAACRAAALG